MAKRFPTPSRFETRKEDDFRRKRHMGLRPERIRFETQCRGGERAATRIKMRGRTENDDSFRERESEVEQRWDKTRCAEYPTRFETLVEAAARRRQPKRGCEREGGHIRLRKMEHEGDRERFGESEREVWDGREKNRAEKTRLGTREGDDIRRKRKRESERAAELVKLRKMEETAEIEGNHESFRELEYLSGCRLSFTLVESQVVTGVYRGSRFWNPLAAFGLRLKEECYLDEDDEHDDAICRLEESYGDSGMIVEEKCKNRIPAGDSMASDDKALRAAMLKSRYSQIILKAQQKRLFN